MSFEFVPLEIPEVLLVRPTRRGDDRGFFMETYRSSAFEDAGIHAVFVQDNHARSAAGVLRGLHYQLPPMAQGKLVRVVRGAVFDVAVDLRRISPSYGEWVGRTLDDASGDMMWIPPGFAHGYAALGDGADLAYKVTAEYDPERDRGFLWNDPAVGVEWPITDPVLSQRDIGLPLLAEAEHTFGVPG